MKSNVPRKKWKRNLWLGSSVAISLAALFALFQNFTNQATGPIFSSRLGVADDGNWTMQHSSEIQQRFNYYLQAGIGILRVDIGWGGMEVGQKVWQAPPNLNYFNIAKKMGLKLKANIGTYDSPAGWFFALHPDAKFVTSNPVDQEYNAISYWYPNLQEMLTQHDRGMFSRLANEGVLSNVAYIVVPMGPAGEGIYPAAWTTTMTSQQYFWCYDMHAQIDFRNKMIQQYKVGQGTSAQALTAANAAWGTQYTVWSQVQVPMPGTHPGQMWSDVLNWYRNTKRNFITWQVQHYQQLLAQYYPTGPVPKLVILLPGQHVSQAEWDSAVASGAGDGSIMIMTDTEFLMDTAYAAGAEVQYTGLPNMPELGYIQAYNKARGYNLSVWGENAGNVGAPSDLANQVVSFGLYGSEYINSDSLFSQADTVTPTPQLTALIAADQWLNSIWTNQLSTGFSFSTALGTTQIPQNSCMFTDTTQARSLCMQGDGNLVLYQGSTALWASGTSGRPCPTGQPWNLGCHASLQGDGNFVLYMGSSAYWSTGTNLQNGDPSASILKTSERAPYLQMQDQNGDTLWSSTDNFSIASFTLKQTQFIRYGSHFYLTMQGDGNLVLYHGANLVGADAVWSSGTSGQNCSAGNCYATLQGDGNFVIYNGANAIWSTSTANSEIAPNVVATLNASQTIPYLSLVSTAGKAVWSSGTSN